MSQKVKAREYQCHVVGFKMLTPTVFEILFEPKIENQPAPLPFVAGQFVSIIVPGAGPGGRDLRRAYSIASAPEKQPIELCVKLVEGGPGTNYLFKLRPGDTFRGLAPYGDFTWETTPERQACFIATGTGVAPFKAMIESEQLQRAAPELIHCLLGVRTEDELLYRQEFGSRQNIRWYEAVSRPSSEWKGFKGRVTDVLRSFGGDYPWDRTDFYLCGNGDMIKEVKSILEEKGVKGEAVFQEKYY